MSWPMVKLYEVADFIRGITFKPEDVVPLGSEGCIACFRTKNVQADLDVSDVWAVSDSFVKKDEKFLEAGDIIMSTANSWNLVGKSCWVPALDYKATVGGFVSILRGRESLIDRRYLYHWINTEHSQANLRKCARQTTNISNLSIAQAENLEIPLPPLEEQKRIAGILDQADVLRRLRARALEKLNTLGQAVFQEMFGDPASTWPNVAVSDVTKDARTGPFGSQLLVSEFVDSGIPVLGIDNVVHNEFRWAKERYITTEKYEQLKRYKVKPGDVLVTIMGTCGRCAVAPNDIGLAINTKHICCMTMQADKVEPEFLQATLLWDPRVLAQLGVEAKGAIMPGLNMGKIASLIFRLPPLEQQKTFIERLDNIKADLIRAEGASAKASALFASLQSAAFQGRL